MNRNCCDCAEDLCEYWYHLRRMLEANAEKFTPRAGPDGEHLLPCVLAGSIAQVCKDFKQRGGAA